MKEIMKKFAFFILFLFNVTYSQWSILYNQLYTFPQCVQFLDSEIGYCVNSLGVIKSTNGGLNWYSSISYSEGIYPHRLYFIDVNYGWVVCQDGFYIKTTNGGSNWVLKHNQDSLNFNGIYFINQLTGWFTGVGGRSSTRIIKTTDGGENWIAQINDNWGYTSIFFINNNTGWAVGYNGRVIKTTNGGLNWLQQQSNATNTLYSVMFITDNIGWAVGRNGQIIKTTNNGINWNFQNSGSTFYDLASVEFVNEQLGWVVGVYNLIIRTTNGGINWHQQNLNTYQDYLTSVCFINDNTGWASGNRHILKTINGGVTNIQIINSEIPQKYILTQNYPNPFNPQTKIKFAVPKASFTKLVIYDLLGREVTTLVNEELKPGTYEADWDGSNYSSGVYFYKIISGDYSKTMKMVLMK